eukprot:528132-Pleurochrysis_carterae.AAC.2
MRSKLKAADDLHYSRLCRKSNTPSNAIARSNLSGEKCKTSSVQIHTQRSSRPAPHARKHARVEALPQQSHRTQGPSKKHEDIGISKSEARSRGSDSFTTQMDQLSNAKVYNTNIKAKCTNTHSTNTASARDKTF